MLTVLFGATNDLSKWGEMWWEIFFYAVGASLAPTQSCVFSTLRASDVKCGFRVQSLERTRAGQGWRYYEAPFFSVLSVDTWKANFNSYGLFDGAFVFLYINKTLKKLVLTCRG